jgi:hypothetical protein
MSRKFLIILQVEVVQGWKIRSKKCKEEVNKSE